MNFPEPMLSIVFVEGGQTDSQSYRDRQRERKRKRERDSDWGEVIKK